MQSCVVDGQRQLYIVKLGTTREEIAAEFGQVEQRIIKGARQSMAIVDPREGDRLPAASRVAGVVITGSKAMVTDREPWSERTAEWLAELVRFDIPILGICYGHQLLAWAHGGDVDFHPGGREIGTVQVRRHAVADTDPLLGDLPPSFHAQAIHTQTVTRLPTGATLLATGDFDPHQAFRLGEWAWGVQFHPEFSPALMRGFLRVLTPQLRKEGLDPEHLEQRVRHSPHAFRLLSRFSQVVGRRWSD